MSKNNEQLIEWQLELIKGNWVKMNKHVIVSNYSSLGQLRLEIDFDLTGEEPPCCYIMNHGNRLPFISKELISTDVSDAVDESVKFLKDEVKKLAIELGLMK